MLSAIRRHGDVLKNAGSLMATTGVSSVMGFAYWAVAARLFSQRVVGYGAATVSAVALLGTIGMFGLGTVLLGELPRRTRRGRLVAAALLAAGLGSLVLGLGFAIVASNLNTRFAQIAGSPARALLIAFSVMLTAVALVFDHATIGVFWGEVQLFRNLVFALAKLLVLPVTAIVVHDQFGAGITISFAVGTVVSLGAAAIQLRHRGAPVLCRPDWGVLRGLGRTALAHNWLNIAIVVPFSAIPVLVTIIISPSANAAFYVAWMLCSFIYLIPQHLSTVLFAVAAANPDAIARKLRFTLKISVLVGLPASIALALGARLALRLFGASYVAVATIPLVLLALGYLPVIPKVHYVAVCRAIGKVSRAATVLTAFTVMEVAAAAVGGVLHGLIGLSVALLVVGIVEGIATTPTVMKAAKVRGRHQGADDEASVSDHPAVHLETTTSSADKIAAQRPISRSLDKQEVPLDKQEVPRKPHAAPLRRLDRGRPVPSDPELTISKYAADYVDSGKPLGYYIARHFGRSVNVLIALHRIPCYHIVLSARPEAAAIRALMLRHSAPCRITGLTTAVLSLPHEAGQYSVGASKQTLRRMVRRAHRLGLSWAEVNDPLERRNLLKVANDYERTHPDVAYRGPNPDNRDLFGYRLWLTAFSADGRPLLLCVALVDGELSFLRYFRAFGTGQEHSTARYFMTEVLVEHLIRLGVRYFFDDVSPFRLSNGLRLFQRPLGFRVARVYIAHRAPDLIGRVMQVSPPEPNFRTSQGYRAS
jgi:O-antigen/teichoic acid export membrane protein